MIFEKSLSELLSQAWQIREEYFGNTVELRMARNYLSQRRCTANCKFCGWSSIARTDCAKRQGLIVEDEGTTDIASCMASAKLAEQFGANFELVCNIERLDDIEALAELTEAIRAASGIVPVGIQPGIIRPANKAYLSALKSAGSSWYCNDLETAPSYFPGVCTSHTIQEKLDSLRMAKELGLPIWSGFCMGMGETRGQRIEAVETLRVMDVEGVILNFFYDFEGIPLHGKVEMISPEEILKTIAVVRIMLPTKPIIIGGGRSTRLGSQQYRIYEAGATGIYLGTFLNHPRPSVEKDLKIISELGLKIVRS